MYNPHTPPVPPPKPASHDISRIGTPAATQSPRPPPHPSQADSNLPEAAGPGAARAAQIARPAAVPDPGDQWLPKYLQDKSKQDLHTILSSLALLSALTHSPSTIHPSLSTSHTALHAALHENIELAAHLSALAAQHAHARAAAQAQLLSTHALARAWLAKQARMDEALAPFAPARLYQRLAGGVAEQGGVCVALEESFLDGGDGGGGGGGAGAGPGDGGGQVSEREAAEWVRRYREAKKLFYLRAERKERWDEGRVGGWR